MTPADPVLSMVDAGFAVNASFPPLVRSHRHVDVILSLNYSWEADQFKVIKQTQEYCTDRKIPFPKIDFKKVESEPLKEVYVFEDKDNPEAPIVLHFPLVSVSHKQFKAPGVKREGEKELKEGAVDVEFNSSTSPYLTHKLTYTPEDFQGLINLTSYNIQNNKDVILNTLNETLNRNRERQTGHNNCSRCKDQAFTSFYSDHACSEKPEPYYFNGVLMQEFMPYWNLSVTVLRGKFNRSYDLFSKCDCYVVLKLPTACACCHRTKTVKNKNSPKWNETFNFRVHSGVKNILEFHIYDADKSTKDDYCSTILFDINNLTPGEKLKKCFITEDKKKSELWVEFEMTASSDKPEPYLSNGVLMAGPFCALDVKVEKCLKTKDAALRTGQKMMCFPVFKSAEKDMMLKLRGAHKEDCLIPCSEENPSCTPTFRYYINRDVETEFILIPPKAVGEVNGKNPKTAKILSSVPIKPLPAKQQIKLSMPVKQVPLVAVVCSGGGTRAMIGTFGGLRALQKLQLLDAVSYITGVSGSTWTMASLYGDANWSNNDINEVMESVKEEISKSVFSVFSLDRYKERMEEREKEGHLVSLIDMWGLAIEYLIQGKKKMGTLSDQQMALSKGQNPLPIYTALNMKNGKTACTIEAEWCEFTPYEVGFTKYGAFIPAQNFGSEYYLGHMVKKLPESGIYSLLGIWSSVFSLSLTQLWTVVTGKIPSWASKLGEDVNQTEKGKKPSASKEPVQLCPMTDLEEKLSNFLTRRPIISQVFNFLRGFQLHKDYSENCDFTTCKDTHPDAFPNSLTPADDKLDLVDSAFVLKSGFPPLLRPTRRADVILSLNYAWDSDHFKVLKQTQEYCADRKIAFPQIDYKKLESEPIREVYVFEDKENPEAPIVIHFPLINISFKQFKSPVSPCDCYVVLKLPTACAFCHRTKTVKNSNSPKWNETFRFRVHSGVKNILEFRIFDADEFTKDDYCFTLLFDINNLTLGQRQTKCFISDDQKKSELWVEFEMTMSSDKPEPYFSNGVLMAGPFCALDVKVEKHLRTNAEKDMMLKLRGAHKEDCLIPCSEKDPSCTQTFRYYINQDLETEFSLIPPKFVQDVAEVDGTNPKTTDILSSVPVKPLPVKPKQQIKLSMPVEQVPMVAVVCSVGGTRAMIGTFGGLRALQKLQLLDAVSYITGASGSTWTLASLYGDANWSNNDINEIMESVKEEISKSLFSIFSPEQLRHYKARMEEREKKALLVSLIDMWGLAIEYLIQGKKEMGTLSDQQMALSKGQNPLPIYTALSMKNSKTGCSTETEWCEFTPYEVGFIKYGAFIPAQNFGSEYYLGHMVKKLPESGIYSLLGIWSSVFSLNLTLLWRRITKVIPSWANNSEEEEKEESNNNTEHKPSTSDTLHVNTKTDLAKKLSDFLTKRPIISQVFNFLRGFHLHGNYSENCDFTTWKDTHPDVYPNSLTPADATLGLVDTGFVFKSGFPPVLRSNRRADVIMSLNYTWETDHFKVLKQTQEYCADRKIPFPKIDYKKLASEPIREVYVFEDKENPVAPIVIHFPLINVSFKQFKSPGVKREGKEEMKEGDFNTDFTNLSSPFSTLKLTYEPEDFQMLANLTTYNILNNKDVILNTLNKALMRNIERTPATTHQNSDLMLRQEVKNDSRID
ncbi:cytosolic phospholipase A2 zeta-like protein [Labeo rohita]|uniref:Phospholipase A2 n=1 Tax=Labeo rohita TaxID=84645 RepID=A0A498P411_LABRO|nr:cytosolic phospholipase A2 zeta-like protein [Labeo rohita]